MSKSVLVLNWHNGHGEFLLMLSFAQVEHRRQQPDVNLLVFLCLTNETFVLCSNMYMSDFNLDVLNRQQIKIMLCGHLSCVAKQKAVCSKQYHLKQYLTVLDLVNPLYLKEEKSCLL